MKQQQHTTRIHQTMTMPRKVVQFHHQTNFHGIAAKVIDSIKILHMNPPGIGNHTRKIIGLVNTAL